jgi:hypothetical protein
MNPWGTPPTPLHCAIGIAESTIDEFFGEMYGSGRRIMALFLMLNAVTVGVVVNAVTGAVSVVIFEYPLFSFFVVIAFPFWFYHWLDKGYENYRPRVEVGLQTPEQRRRRRRALAKYMIGSVAALVISCWLHPWQ